MIRFAPILLFFVTIFACKNESNTKKIVVQAWKIVSVNSPAMQAEKDTMLSIYKYIDDSLGNGDSLVSLLLKEENEQYANSLLEFKSNGTYVLDVTVQQEKGKWNLANDTTLEFIQVEGSTTTISKIKIKEINANRMVLLSTENNDTVTMILEPRL